MPSFKAGKMRKSLFDYRIFSFFRQNVPFSTPLRWLRTSSLWTYRTVVWSVLAVALLSGATVLGLRYWILPNIETYRVDIAGMVSAAAKQRITIGRIAGNWDGIRPQLVFEDITVHDRAGQPALALAKVDGTLSWRSLATLQLRLHSLDIYDPVLDIRRDAAGVITVAGMAVTADPREGGGVAEWLLQQRNIEVHNAAVSWTDELKAAPRLELRDVRLLIANRGRSHRFGLQAVPPAELAGPLDMRGEFSGSGAQVLADLNGRLFIELGFADIAAWRTWVPLPVDVPSGAGAVRTWLTFAQNDVREIIADVRLASVRTRLGEGLEELDLAALSGRLAWKTLPAGFQFSTTKLTLTTGQGASLQPMDLQFRLAAPKGDLQQGEFHANAVDLAALATVADRLPLDELFRRELAAFGPSGNLYDVGVRWTGPWRKPLRYAVRARFEDLSLKNARGLPGITGASGNLDTNEKAGALHLSAQRAAITMPSWFEQQLAFDTLTAHVGWTLEQDRFVLRLNNVSFSNADVTGTVSGSYRSGEGEIDLTGSLTRADARALPRYLPLPFAQSSRAWLQRAIVAGSSADVKFRVKGRAADFPFADGRKGIFQVQARISGGVIDYAEGWPRIENIEGDVQFRGRRMEVLARQGRIQGARLGKVQATITGLGLDNEILTVSGEAEGATSDFLEFIARSPVADMIDRFTEDMRAQGRGRLALRLVMPLEATRQSRVTGTYEFINNTIIADPDWPPLRQVNGRLEFTEASVRVPGMNGLFLGGPVSAVVTTGSDTGVRMVMQGRVTAGQLMEAAGSGAFAVVPKPLLSNFKGAMDWQGTFTLRRKQLELVVESSMQGMAVELPAPFSKAAADAVPLRLERRPGAGENEQLTISWGDEVSARFEHRLAGAKRVLERGEIRFGEAARELKRAGIWVGGTLKTLDTDDWLRLLGEQQPAGAVGGLAGLDLRIGELRLFNRRFQDLSISGSSRGPDFALAVSGKELEGTGTWQPQGAGRLTARFRKLVIPPALAWIGKPPAAAVKGGKAPNLPALDVIAEQFQMGQRQLGRMELSAVHEGRDWRIERMRLSSPDSTLNVDGLWQSWLSQPRTQVNVTMQVADIGRALVRWGYPEGVRRGTAKIEGTLSWAGGPPQFDYPTLSGNLVLDAAGGQFVKLDPGLGKLLGILSLQSLPRRITLDFRDIFSEGLAFDSIVGALRINRGVAMTDNFRIEGPSARVVMSGEVDLGRETQKLRVRVSPHISDGVSIAGALIGGPLAGVAAFVAQKLLKDPLERLVAFEYAVAGTWDEPLVTKLDQRGATAAAE